MNRWLTLCMVVVAAACSGGESLSAESSETSAVCSDSWARMIDEKVPTGDGQGHGPDIGSEEWKSVIEFKLGIRSDPGLPSRDSEAWCRHIDRIVHSDRSSLAGSGKPVPATGGAGPSFDCGKVGADGVEAMICGDPELSALDRKLSVVYADASEKATNEHPPVLKAMQRGWIKGRDDCWKSDDERGCVREAYVRRIAELQALYRLVPFNGPIRFECDGNPANEIVASYFETDPPTLIAERGDSVSLMFLQPSGSGSRYQGPNESLWEHQGEASITWGYDAPEMHCTKSP